MPNNIKWIKIVTDIFDDDKLLLIEKMPHADSLIIIWFKLLCLSGKLNGDGVFMLSDSVPYTDTMLATVLRRPIGIVREALRIFEEFGMVKTIDGVLTLPNWKKYQSIDPGERRRDYMKNYMRGVRERQKAAATANTQFTVSNVEEEKEKNTEEKSIENERKEEEDGLLSFDHPFESEDLISEDDKRNALGGRLGGGVVMLSKNQLNDLCDRLSIDELNRYLEIVRDCELSGKHFRNKTHYQAILDMATKDRGVGDAG